MGTRAGTLTWLPFFIALSLLPSGCGAGLTGREAPSPADALGDTGVRSMLVVAKPQAGEGAERQPERPALYGPREPRMARRPYGLVPEPLVCLVRHDCLLPLNLHASYR